MEKHEREEDDNGPSKRLRIDQNPTTSSHVFRPPLLSLLPPTDAPAGKAKESLLESDVGITEYIDASLPSFSAIVKHRFTDFLVYEVGKDDEAVRLKDIQRPARSPEEAEAKPAEAVEAPTPANTWPETADAALAGILDPSVIVDLRALVEAGPPPPSARGSGGGRGRGRGRGRGNDRGGRGRGRGGAANGVSRDPASEASASGTATGDALEVSDVTGEGQSEPAISQVLSQPVESKEARTTIHKTIRELFGGRLQTETDSKEDGRDVIAISWANDGRSGARRAAAPKDNHPPFIHFTLQKTNRETQDALSILSRILHCHPSKDLSICGTKDKRSVSVQRVAFKRGRKTLDDVWKAIASVGGGERGADRERGKGGRGGGRGGRGGVPSQVTERGDRGMRIGDLSYADQPLRLGQLHGNRFVITLRDVMPQDPDTLSRAMSTLRDRGFLNYFGMQRFGTSSLGTHMVGLALLRSDWALATDLILRVRPGEAQEVEMARRVWAEGAKGKEEAKEAAKAFQRNRVAERAVLEHFAKQGAADHLGAVSAIPRNLRLMYVHAYQSYLWNSVLSERVRLFGCDRPVIGDLVLVSGDSEELGTVGDDADVDDGDLENDTNDSGSMKVKVLATEADVAAYTVHDVVLPLAGYTSVYPSNELAKVYEEMMKADGLDWKDLKRSKAEYSMAGTYRKIIHRPKDLSHHLLRYTSPDHPLARADEDVLLDIPLPVEAELVTDAGHASLALQVELTLGTSTYATMALREVLKNESGSAAQRDLTREMNRRLATVASGSAEAGPGQAEEASMAEA